MTKVVKIGGGVVADESALKAFCKDFADMQGPKVLVHGGGTMADKLLKALGHEPVMTEGRRVTDENTLKAVTMVYAGWCNRHITALLQSFGCNAIGLAGCDASSIKAERRAPRVLSDGRTTVDYGFVGDVTPESVNAGFILGLLEAGITPAFCAINHDGRGNLLNTNADTIASSIASALHAELICCFDKKGVLYDKDDADSVIPELTEADCERLRREGRISEGMLPKIENSFAALRSGTASVRITHAACLLSGSGTLLKP